MKEKLNEKKVEGGRGGEGRERERKKERKKETL
jgi:hypothetical protein